MVDRAKGVFRGGGPGSGVRIARLVGGRLIGKPAGRPWPEFDLDDWESGPFLKSPSGWKTRPSCSPSDSRPAAEAAVALPVLRRACTAVCGCAGPTRPEAFRGVDGYG